jgi:ureidoacrylate peracid hydrolase
VLDARPMPLTLDGDRTAVIVVDMQNDFGSSQGMFARGGVDVSAIQQIVPNIAAVLAASRKADIPVIYLQMAFRPDLSDMGELDSPNWRDHHLFGVGSAVQNPDGSQGRLLIRDTWNTDIVPELKPEAGDVQIYKTRFSGFYQTELHETLQRLGAKYLIVTGCTTSVCVESTIRDAMFRDYCPVLLTDCTAEPIGSQFARSNRDASVLLVEMLFGWTTSSEAYLRAIESMVAELSAPLA